MKKENTDYCSIHIAARRSGVAENAIRRLVREHKESLGFYTGNRFNLNYAKLLEMLDGMGGREV